MKFKMNGPAYPMICHSNRNINKAKSKIKVKVRISFNFINAAKITMNCLKTLDIM